MIVRYQLTHIWRSIDATAELRTPLRADLDAAETFVGQFVRSVCSCWMLRAQLQHVWFIHCLAAHVRIHMRLEWIPKWAVQHLAIIEARSVTLHAIFQAPLQLNTCIFAQLSAEQRVSLCRELLLVAAFNHSMAACMVVRVCMRLMQLKSELPVELSTARRLKLGAEPLLTIVVHCVAALVMLRVPVMLAGVHTKTACCCSWFDWLLPHLIRVVEWGPGSKVIFWRHN